MGLWARLRWALSRSIRYSPTLWWKESWHREKTGRAHFGNHQGHGTAPGLRTAQRALHLWQERMVRTQTLARWLMGLLQVPPQLRNDYRTTKGKVCQIVSSSTSLCFCFSVSRFHSYSSSTDSS